MPRQKIMIPFLMMAVLGVALRMTPSMSFTPTTRVLPMTMRPVIETRATSTWQRQQQQNPNNNNGMMTLRMSASDDGESKDDDNNKEEKEEETVVETTSVEMTNGETPKTVSRLTKWRKKFYSKPDDGLTFRQRLAKAGLSVVLSYGWVSNTSYAITVSLAWYIFSKQSGLSPLAPGQWKPFLAVYAGFWVFNNIIRPIRFGLSVAVSLYFDNFVQKVQDKFKVSKGLAIGLTVFLVNVVGTCTLMGGGIALASMAAGVPIFPPKP